jgi:hypothetical protein
MGLVRIVKEKLGMKKSKLHNQDWRDFQPILDPEGIVEKFKAALKRAGTRVERKREKSQAVRRAQPLP